jgi:hypothetical protein
MPMTVTVARVVTPTGFAMAAVATVVVTAIVIAECFWYETVIAAVITAATQ